MVLARFAVMNAELVFSQYDGAAVDPVETAGFKMILEPKPAWLAPVESPPRPPTPPAREKAMAKPPRKTVSLSADHSNPTRGPKFFQ